MSVTTENAPVQGQTTLQENSAGEGVYASLFEKINLTPASRLGDINDFLDDAALSEAPAAERLTAAMQVFMERIRQSGQRVEKLDKTLIDHHIAELDFQISRQLDAVMHHQEFQQVESLWRGLKQLVLDTVLQPVIFVLNTDDEAQEYRRMKRDGEARVAVLFPDAGEASNAEQPAGLVRALFDDQVHDSRAWFMYAALGTREMWTGYFRYRMIYFSERCSKPLSPLVLAGDLVGFATVTAGVVLSFRQKRLTGKLAGLAATGAVRSLEVAVLDKITGEALPELPGGAQLRAFTHEPGTVVAQQKARKAEEQLARGQAALPASWLEDVLTTTV
ncbi:TPA: type VI secretion system contractile sheath domain-containing protein [Klebsiella variicola subsp. variicola]